MPRIRNLKRQILESRLTADRALDHAVGITTDKKELVRKALERRIGFLEKKLREARRRRRTMPVAAKLVTRPKAWIRLFTMKTRHALKSTTAKAANFLQTLKRFAGKKRLRTA